MTRSNFLKSLLLLLSSTSLFARNKRAISIRLIRHATLVLELNNQKILVDPMLSAKGEMDPVQNCGNNIRIPMVDLPLSENELSKLLAEVDAVLITHIHRDHWDVAAQKQIDKNKLIYCQPGDEVKIKEQGFQNVKVIDLKMEWNGITIHRSGGQHGTGEIGQKMGKVSGYVLKANGTTIYVAGDTIWCDDVKQALTVTKPDVIVLNTGGAKFLTGDPITMTADDVLKVHEHLPSAKIITVHMDTVNHCFVKRTDLAHALSQKELKVLIPKDGEIIEV